MKDSEISISPGMGIQKEIRMPQNRDWLQTLPYPHITYMDYGKYDRGIIIEMNADKWHGIYEKKDSEYDPGQHGILKLEPFIDESIMVLPDNSFMDTKIARIDENGRVVPKTEEGWKILLPSMPDWENSEEYHPLVRPKEEDIPLGKDGTKLMFRGVDFKAMQRFLKKGRMRSGEVEQGLPDLDRPTQLFFAGKAESAFGYAVQGHGYDQPSFEQPSYVIAMKIPDSDNVTFKSTDDQIIINTDIGISLEDVAHVYEIRPYKITRSVDIPLGINSENKSMSLLLGNHGTELAPKILSVYKEVQLEDIQIK